jgi:hypothetical protein
MFQFDSGTYDQTLDKHGRDILTLDARRLLCPLTGCRAR